MNFQEDHIYHIYNRGNNKQRVFFIEENYYFFIRKMQKELDSFASILAYCLMPNHFNIMVLVKPMQTDQITSSRQTSPNLNLHPLVRKIGTLLSSYTRAINIQENRTGSLFQQKTKSKCLNCEESSFLQVLTCLNYIHQNPIRAGLVKRMEDWQFSSFNEYVSENKIGLCNKNFVFQVFNINSNKFYDESYEIIDPMYLKKIW